MMMVFLGVNVLKKMMMMAMAMVAMAIMMSMKIPNRLLLYSTKTSRLLLKANLAIPIELGAVLDD